MRRICILISGWRSSAPLEWKEIEEKKISIRDFTTKNMLERVEEKGDLFKAVLSNKQSLEEAFEKAKVRIKKSK